MFGGSVRTTLLRHTLDGEIYKLLDKIVEIGKNALDDKIVQTCNPNAPKAEAELL